MGIEEYKLDDLKERCYLQLNPIDNYGRVVLTQEEAKIIVELIDFYKENKFKEEKRWIQ